MWQRILRIVATFENVFSIYRYSNDFPLSSHGFCYSYKLCSIYKGHVFAGTGTGIYESKDGAGSWRLLSETASFGTVMSFREGTINGKQYGELLQNHFSFTSSLLLTLFIFVS